jgi:hypothetical protein
MKNLLALATFLVLLGVTVGYFRGWFNISSTPSSDGHNQITIDVNTQKVKQDEEKVRDMLHKKDTSKSQSSCPTGSCPNGSCPNDGGIPTPPDLPPLPNTIDPAGFEVPVAPPLPPMPPPVAPIPQVPESGFVPPPVAPMNAYPVLPQPVTPPSSYTPPGLPEQQYSFPAPGSGN